MGRWPISPWMEWFAWRPVQVVDEQATEQSGYQFYRWVWLKKIWRQRVLISIPTGEHTLVWEYKDKNIFDILKDS